MNQVQKIAINFSGEDESFFRSLYADWDHYWTSRMENSTELILEKYNDKSYTIEIETLDLQLGIIRQSDFSTFFISKYEEALEEAILKSLHGNGVPAKKIEITKSNSELLFHFLLHGSIPWNTKIKNLNLLFINVTEKDGKSLRTFLMTYGHYTSLQQRLVLQFDEKTLKTGVKITAPSESHFILSYVELVQIRHRELRAKEINSTQHYQTIWQVIYAYLLTNRSSFFNKKSFLEQTIRQLANRHLTTYSELLRLLLLNSKQDRSYPMELMTLLRSLKKEEEFNSGAKSDWKTWIKYLILADQDLVIHLAKEKNTLIKLLRNDNNYLLLELLQETQILKLVEIVVPQQNQFIKAYVRELKQQKENGILQGKAGSEFRLVKWQLLFPILLENTGVGFNRRHFVERVLQKVAARYNLKMGELLEYLKKETSISRRDKNLLVIFNELYIKVKKASHLPKQTIDVINSSKIIPKLHSKEVTLEETKKWLGFLKNEINRNRLLEQLSEKQHRNLIELLYKNECKFIFAYDAVINQQKSIGSLQGKTSGKLSTLKWQFIHAVLLEPKNQVFNKRYFVETVAHKIAAHYNLKIEELIAFLYLDSKKNNFSLPFELVSILADLHKEYEQKQQKKESIKSEKSNEELTDFKTREKFLTQHFGKEEQLYFLIRKLAEKREFVRFIQSVLEIESALRQFIIQQLTISIDRKQLLLLLVRISMSHKQLNKVGILKKIIVFFFSQLKTTEQKVAFHQQLEKTAETNALLKQSMKLSAEKEESIEEPEELIVETVEQSFAFISNAGLILIAPYLPRLFSILQLTENGKFKDRNAQVRAIFLIQYAVFGRTEFPEYELQLNKLLTGFKTGVPLPLFLELTDEEMKTTEGMLHGIIQHWNKVKSIDGLREGFLMREGKLEEKDEIIELTIESKAFDMLLDSVPWNFRTTNFSWMEKTIQVNWR